MAILLYMNRGHVCWLLVVGCLLVIGFLFVGLILVVFWLCVGYWLYVDCLLAFCWYLVGCLLVIGDGYLLVMVVCWLLVFW